jgi:hypothetical protein
MRGAAEHLGIVAARAGAIGQKQQIEARRLGRLRQRRVVANVEARARHGVRVPPGGDVMAGRIKESA